jgi:ribonucleoside-triphosphate reductase
MQLRHANSLNLKWDRQQQTELAMKMYDKVFDIKFLPPGRGLWALGSKITEEKKLYTALNNCAFVSTSQPTVDNFIDTFTFLMDSSMVGVGVGFDTKGEGLYRISRPSQDTKQTYAIPDTREGWVESVKKLMESYFKPN